MRARAPSARGISATAVGLLTIAALVLFGQGMGVAKANPALHPPDSGSTEAHGLQGHAHAPAHQTQVQQSGQEIGPQNPADGAEASTSPAPQSSRKSDTTGILLRTVLLLASLVGLAYLGAHPKIQRIEEILGVSQVITAGFPFLLLGVIATLDPINALNEAALMELTPLLQFGLGWLGFLAGFKFDVRFLERLPFGTARAVALQASAPLIIVALGAGGLMWWLSNPVDPQTVVRDALALGIAGAMTAPHVAPRLTLEGVVRADTLSRVEQLDESVGVLGLLFLAAFFRPDVALFRWSLPGTVWVFITLGLGVTAGLVLFMVVRKPATGSEMLAITLGSVAFTAGLAGYLWLSPLVICFVAGALVVNLPWRGKDDFLRILEQMERPIYLVFLTMVGASWQIADWRGWVLVPAFVVARLLGRQISISVLRKWEGSPPTTRRLAIAPLSVLSIAIVLSVQTLYARNHTVQWIVTAVIGGALASEMLVQLFGRRTYVRPQSLTSTEPTA